MLLCAAVAAQIISALGLALSRTAADRLHYASAAYTVGPFCVLAAILIREKLTSGGLDSIAAVGLLLLTGPLVVHATGRAIRRREGGEFGPQPSESAD